MSVVGRLCLLPAQLAAFLVAATNEQALKVGLKAEVKVEANNRQMEEDKLHTLSV